MQAAEPPQDLRRYDIDWLRVLVIGLLIPFHTAMIFDDGADFYVKNSASSRFLTEAANLVGAAGMPLLFFVAGAAAWYALKNRRPGRFMKERALRLLIPLLVSMLTLVPLMGYFGRLFHARTGESFPAYYPRFFASGGGDISGFTGDFSPGHLWFVLFLFILTMAALPIFSWLRGAGGRRFEAAAAGILSRPGAILLGIPVLLLLDGLPELAGRNLFAFFFFLIAGFLWMSDPKIQDHTDRQHRLLLGICLIAAFLFLLLRRWGERQVGFTLGALAFDLIRETLVWTAILAVLGFAHRRLNRPGGAIRYLGPASYPFYILHLPAVVAVGYLAVRWDAAPGPKFLAISAGSLAATLLVYELLVRRIPVVGRLLGGGAGRPTAAQKSEKPAGSRSR
jgi:hypothetical protein